MWRWDVKSVNARGLDLRFRLPPGRESLEPELRKRVQAHVKRGSILISLSVQDQADVAGTCLDGSGLAAAVHHVVQARAALEAAGIPVAPTRPEAVLSLAGVRRPVSGAEAQGRTDVSAAMLDSFDAVLADLITMRHAEGEQLARVITEQVTQIEVLTREAEALCGDAVDALRNRLRAQVAALVSDTGLAPGRLEQEVAMLAAKADIREELDRLLAHVAAVCGLIAERGAVGRRVDFLAQEFNREANTLCSKSATDALTRVGLDLKTVIEQLREQAANVE